MAFGKKKTQLVIPPPKLARAQICIGGEMLVAHRFGSKARREIEEKQRGLARNKKGMRDPEAEYNDARYLDEKGRDCIPAAAVRRAITDAASFIDGITKVSIRGAVFVRGESRGEDGRALIPLKYKQRRMREDVVRLSNGSADLRYRPEYTDWSADLTVEYDEDVLTAQQIHHLFQRAGISIGLSEERPQKGGDWGTFTLKNVVSKRAAKRHLKAA